MQESSQHHAQKSLLVAFVILLLFVTGLYASAIHFGLIWDDPEWYVRVVGKSFFELIQPYPDYQFYRPALMVYNRLFVQADGTFAMTILHWAQISWYLLNLPLVFAISQRLGFHRWAAFMIAVLTAFHPFTYQAVAWAAPGQPPATLLLNAALFLYLIGRKNQSSKTQATHPAIFIFSLILFILAMSIHETTVVFAVMPLLFEIVLRLQDASWETLARSWRHPWQAGWGRASLFLLAGILFFVVWLFVPKESGITGLFWDSRIFVYLLQGFVGPFADARLGHLLSSDGVLAASWCLLILALWGVSIYRRRGYLATLGIIWAILGIAPVLISLPYEYVKIAARLFYGSIPGVAWLWVCALWPSMKKRMSVTAIIGIASLVFVATFGLATTIGFKQLYTAGISHLNTMVDALADKDGHYLFLNFPDRYRLKEEPLTAGYWGVTLAPVVVDLAEFPALLNDSNAQTISHSMPWIDEAARTDGPYVVDMRGVITSPDELYQLAQTQDGLYITRYDTAGHFDLHFAGALQENDGATCETAVFDNNICLHTIELIPDGNHIIVRTTWQTDEQLPPHITLFTHLGQPGLPPNAQADGDSWHGALPLANWRPSDFIIDERRLPSPEELENLYVSVGVYNWVSGERLAGVDAAERPLSNNAYTLPLLSD